LVFMLGVLGTVFVAVWVACGTIGVEGHVYHVVVVDGVATAL